MIRHRILSALQILISIRRQCPYFSNHLILRRPYLKIIGVVFLCFASGMIRAQPMQSNLRHVFIQTSIDSIQLDSTSLAFNSVEIYLNSERVVGLYTVSYSKAIIYLDSSLLNKNLEVYYRVLNIPNKSVFFHKNREIIEPSFMVEPRAFYNYKQDQSASQAIFGDGLNVEGNIARGIGFGNNQDVVLNSNLNLQLNGNLGKGFSIQAAISDENNPIQPEGNTQQIQDFDKVFISLFKDSNSLTVGDFLMQTDNDQYFMKYYKKSRGLKVDYTHKGKVTQHIQANGAVSRGKFVRNEIQGQEGIQGPYRLQGANGEFNIIIISGTEVVYLDGEKLERGQQNDYIIDYNTGEIIFMPGRLINRYNRIIVEFQYSDRNYSRSVFTASDALSFGNWKASVNYFTEQDNKLQPTDTSNGTQIQTVLENAGDNPAIFQNEKRYSFLQPDRVNYIKKDTLSYTIYQFTNEPEKDTVFYTTTFSYVGVGKGNYKQIASSANGRVFSWVEPINGFPQGDYEPYIQLVAPKRFQMLTANAAYSPSKKFEAKFEAAYSNDNRNTYSLLDKSNDEGLGLFFSLRQSDYVYKNIKLGSSVKVEYINSTFRSIERYRNVEFNRIWNRQLNNTIQTTEANELVSTVSGYLNKEERHFLKVDLSNYNKSKIFEGYRGQIDYLYVGKFLGLKIYDELLSVDGVNGNIKFKNRSQNRRTEANYTFEKVRFGASGTYEESKFSTDTGSGLDKSSFRYEMLSGFIESNNLKTWKFRADANYRADYLSNGSIFKYASTGVNFNSYLEHVGKKLNRFKFIGSYRILNDANFISDDEVLLSRVEYNASFLKKVIVSSTYYQVGTGREQRRQFSYAQVQAGNGTHTWNDYNENGIEEIDEFELAVFKDQARYVKIYLPTNEFIKSNTNEFNQTLRFQAPTTWQSGRPYKRFISRFSTITSYRADRKITDNRLETILNPFKLNVSDTALIAVSSLIKQTTFFNRSNAKFGIEHTIQTNKGKQFLNSGFEWRQNDKQQVIGRYSFNRSLNLILDGEMSRKQNRNDFFENRNYNFTSTIFRPELYYQSLKGIRVGSYFKYTEAFNAPELGNDRAYISETGLEFRYFIINRGNFDAKIASHSINFIGNSNSPLAFDVLNGLSNGRNLTWNFGFGGKTKTNIQFNVSYEGRRSPLTKTIHIGRAEARYIF